MALTILFGAFAVLLAARRVGRGLAAARVAADAAVSRPAAPTCSSSRRPRARTRRRCSRFRCSCSRASSCCTAACRERLIAFASSVVGHVRGGLGQVNVLSCLLFGGVSGSAIADVSAIGGSMIPQMVERGYDRDYAVNVTITAALVALLVPPSHNLILYSAAAGGGISIADLFAAGILPALLLMVSVMLTAYFVARRRGYATAQFPGMRMVRDEPRRGAAGAAARVRDFRRHPRRRVHGRRERERRGALCSRRDGARVPTPRLGRVQGRVRERGAHGGHHPVRDQRRGDVRLVVGLSRGARASRRRRSRDRRRRDDDTARDERRAARARHVHGHGPADHHLHADLPAGRDGASA